MAKDRFYIGPYDKDSGQQTNYKPFLIPDEAFAELNNAYVFRGRVRKRFGSRWLGDSPLLTRLRINIGTTDGAGNFNGFTPRSAALTPIATPAIGQLFSIGTQVFTVVALGNPSVMLISGTATLATFDTTTGQVIINGAAINTIVYYYPALPVMGLLSAEQISLNNEDTIAFDTRFAYQYVNGWERLNGEATPDAAFWTGSNSQFFWGETWTGTNASDRVFFVTNFNELEPNFMRYFFNNQWNNFRPQIDAVPNYLNSARIIVPFKNRLVCFNTWEGPNLIAQQNYTNRCRYSQVGSPLAVDAFRQDIPGKGNAIDCPTTEAITTVEFIKDRLIVFFERSTWELVYTGNQAYPFSWQKINTELGAESTFSIVPFDKVCIGVGNVGIHACNGVNVERIDDKIPDTVFEIHNTDGGVFRVYGIRDYFVEMIYWTFPDIDTNSSFPYPNRILVYNYKTGTWAFNDDSITCFGYFFQPPIVSATWDSTTITWDDSESWDGGSLQVQFRQVLAGNQEGYVFICDSEAVTNCAALQITNISVAAGNVITITAIDHNLRDEDFILIQNIIGTGNLTLLNNKIFKVTIDPSLPNTFTIIYFDPANPSLVIAGTYRGNGIMARVSQIDIKTKEYNFYANQNRNAYISRLDFMVDKTSVGQLLVNFFTSTSVAPLVQDSAANGSLLGTSILETFPYTTFYPYEATSARIWHPVFFSAEGEVVSFQITMNDAQMTSVTVNTDGTLSGPTFVDFQMHGVIISAQPTSSRLQ